ncbi:hypothetical protein FVEN_g879 [Fusarium venenatum]|uniref:Zn(2)-C6 fungal-type domain-containing protein n=1 Tax=Fusarium venenatum TaxID=56646 RepID=A0A2L2TI32_9HYPO|nr:uncharacterized protein FVRRES_10709 [Fusarium venenatum]KAG8361596.1 hypothetical protein FVEN_g879 [Fusarium venenatum]KAH6967294.1 fungal-specific transcription factor domain-containing protein [Fusarium venenatum]CEI70632.1 unnamed protein product [Fusarium venenatum]
MSFTQRKNDARTKRQSGRRSRSFGGCVTCRGRRVKCDEGRPGCSMCHIAGVECGGYNKDIFFDFDDPSISTTKFRRPLLTYNERKRMSEQIAQDVPPTLASWHLSKIDDECEKSSSEIQISRGPFGAFRVKQRLVQNPASVLEVAHGDLVDCSNIHEVDDEEDIVIPDLDFDIELITPSVGITTTEQVTRQPQDWSNSFDSLPLTNWLNPGNIDIPDWWDSMDIGPVLPWADMSVITPKPRSPILISSTIQVRSSIPPLVDPSPSPGPLVEDDVPRDAVLLIKHYSTTVLRGLTPYRHSKTPWHILFLPHVKNCLAALTLGDEMDHASLCAFYGTLSISAFSLGGIYNSKKWLNQGKTYYRQAHYHIRMMLKTAYNLPKKAKYKSILMALLTMVQISVLSGNKDEAEYYFLETEKFIRLRGLNRRKSRKVRLLHHCYVFERLSHESSFTDSRLNLDHRNQVREAIEASDARVYSLDNLSFRLTSWRDLDQEMLKVKGQEEGENDLHLQHPGIWSATLYPEIFGVPELHLFMLSLVIRLAREKDENQDEAIPLKEFMGRAKAVERWIKQLHILRQSIWTAETPVDPEQQQSVDLLNSLADTMQHALSVYFYRRIYDLDPGMLEKHVLGVRDRLLEFDDSDAGMGYGSLRLIWPAFIAACETNDTSVRDSFSRWFERSAKKSGLRIFTETIERIKNVWNGRDSANTGLLV